MSCNSETEIKQAIANLEQILNAGATTVTLDGETTVFNLEHVSLRLNALKQELANVQGKKPRRRVFNGVDLS